MIKDIFEIKGKCNGPVVTILGGVHGDELTGIRVIDLFVEKLKLRNSQINRNPMVNGTLFVGYGNPAAIKIESRGVTSRDLNRCFVKEEIEQDDVLTPDQKRAKELLPILEKTDFLFDIHSTSNPSEPFVCSSQFYSESKDLLQLFPVKNFLSDTNNVLAKDLNLEFPGTTDYFVNNFGANGKGGIAFCYETGYEKDITRVVEVTSTIIDLLEKLNIVSAGFRELFFDEPSKLIEKNQSYWDLEDCVSAIEDEFAYSDGMDKGWVPVEKGTLVGVYGSGKKEVIEQDGMYIFPKNVSKIKKGESLYYLAKKIPDLKTL